MRRIRASPYSRAPACPLCGGGGGGSGGLGRMGATHFRFRPPERRRLDLTTRGAPSGIAVTFIIRPTMRPVRRIT